MACTIVSTPATGAADWTGWITQQGLTDRGFMRVSLTNFSASAASNVATGSVMELAGSIYSFTDTTISLAAGTPSAAQAVYYTIIPAAGGTTCTVVMEGTAPTWVDSKQGYYASAASLTRYIGGTYLNSLTSFYSKWLYEGQNESRLKTKVLRIGEWNMDATTSIVVDHGIADYTKIRLVQVLIRPDVTVEMTDLTGTQSSTIDQHRGGRFRVQATNIFLLRTIGGEFDGVNYDGTASTVASRGWITLEYEA